MSITSLRLNRHLIFLTYLIISEIFIEFNGFPSAALNLSSLKSQPRPPDNCTIQSTVKHYVDKYVNEYTVKGHMSVLCLSYSIFDRTGSCP